MKVRKGHHSFLADGSDRVTDYEVSIVGRRKHGERPYLRVGRLNGELVCSIENANALRALARRISAALEAPE